MTLDVTSFIDSKGGNSEEIRESQRKRGHSVELVDEIIQMYQDLQSQYQAKTATMQRNIKSRMFKTY